MYNILPIGTVISLNNGFAKIMIVSRFPLYNFRGEIGYFDYSGCLYPSGIVDNQTYFFNSEDIDKIWFEGYIDEKETEVQEMFKEQTEKIEYPHFTVNDIK